jgi:hypothetical protein
VIITALKPSSQKEAWSLRRTAGMIQPLKGTVRLMAGRPGFFRKLLKMLHGHGAGVVVRADGAGDRVVVGADQDPPGGAGTRLDLCDHVGNLDAVIVIALQTRLDPDPPVEIPDMVRRLFEVSRNPDAALADLDREHFEVVSQPGFRCMDIDHFRCPWFLGHSGMRGTGCAMRKKKAAECEADPNQRLSSESHVIRG